MQGTGHSNGPANQRYLILSANNPISTTVCEITMPVHKAALCSVSSQRHRQTRHQATAVQSSAADCTASALRRVNVCIWLSPSMTLRGTGSNCLPLPGEFTRATSIISKPTGALTPGAASCLRYLPIRRSSEMPLKVQAPLQYAGAIQSRPAIWFPSVRLCVQVLDSGKVRAQRRAPMRQQ